MENKIHTNAFLKGDPFAKFVIQKLKFSPISFAFTWTILVVVIGFGTTALSNTFITTTNPIGILQDWVWLIWTFFVTPCIAGYYLWSSNSIGYLLQKLELSTVINIQENEINKIEVVYANPWRKIVSVILMLISGIFYYISREEFSGFATSSLLTRIGTTIPYSCLAYIFGMLVFTLILNVWSIRYVVRNKVFEINPLHPDRSGGLRMLSDYSLKIIYLIAVFGIVLGISGYRLISSGHIWTVIILIVLYISVALISFFSPLGSAHEEMKKAKNNLLLALGKQYWDEYIITQKLIDENTDSLTKEIEKIKQLKELYEITSEFPVWPFDITSLRRFGITITTPIIPIIFGLIKEFLIGFLEY